MGWKNFRNLRVERMNYVGQLAGSVLGRVRELYSGVNPATLSGAIDVVVVRQQDGSFRSSPFHVRFGKLGVLHSAEIGVDIEVNGEPVDLQMRLGENGEGFFVQEVDRSESTEAPSVSITIPTVHQPSTLLPERNESSLAPITPKSMHTTPVCDTPTRRQHWVKSRMRRKQDEAAGEVDDVGESTLPACDSIYFSFVDMPEDISHEPCEGSFPDSEEEHRSRSPSPKSDSELEMRPIHSSTSEQCMEWDWGRLPQVSWSDLGHQKTQSAPPSPTSRVAPQLPGIELGNNITSPIVELIREGAPHFSSQSDILGLENHKEDLSNGPPMLAPDDVLSPASQEVSLYFPNSDPYPLPPPVQNNENNDKHINEDPEELGEPQEDCVALSLCGGLAQSWDIPEDWFLKHQISYSEFCQNPSIMEDPRLVLRIHNKYYNWATAAPIILCMQVFNRELPQEVINQVTQQKMPRNRSWWFSWRRRNIGPPVSKPPECGEQKVESSSNRLKEDDEAREAPAQPLTYQRSLRLTSEQIKRLNLHNGANDVVFSVCTKFQGTCRSRAQIYLWDSEDRIIVSDIDGTVTRSDALGHILPQFGKDWTQPGIVQLYHAIHTNGYNFLYCSARSVGLAELTKGYLRGVSERGCTLPPGPLLLSPSSLFTALHREVIEKAPERFKISCLSDICQLFPEPQPFHAAFGNRPNDVLAYKEVGVPESRIFTVNTKGELTQDLNPSFKSSYSALSELVNVMFPPTTCCSVSALLSPEFSHFSFWRDPLPSLSEEEFTQVS
ncbi:phosphatidate phosphatase LPIN3 isoform X2 [Xenopus laevis]|uniref:phosphatidate phosphatase n=1 Tax=Xenopus laevis TaxID=8355 RepID=A0A8J1LWD0_XENLA|nr:phosphatidate phosphatase LPIN3 isoform X2 [Xenopus laevis]